MLLHNGGIDAPHDAAYQQLLEKVGNLEAAYALWFAKTDGRSVSTQIPLRETRTIRIRAHRRRERPRSEVEWRDRTIWTQSAFLDPHPVCAQYVSAHFRPSLSRES